MIHSKTLIRNNLGQYTKTKEKYKLTLNEVYKYIYFVETPSVNRLILPSNKNHETYIFIKDNKGLIKRLEFTVGTKWGGYE